MNKYLRWFIGLLILWVAMLVLDLIFDNYHFWVLFVGYFVGSMSELIDLSLERMELDQK